MQPQKPSLGTVLVVDDDPALLRAYCRILRREGFVTEPAGDGRAAQEKLRARATSDIDLVVTDVGMPDVDGIEVLKLSRELDPDLPVIIMTGGPTLETAVRALEYGALRYLFKPVDEVDLLSAVKQAVGLRRVAKLQREAAERYGHTTSHGRERADLDGRLSQAIEKLWMAYQPIVTWSARNVYAYEALVRTDHPTLTRPDELFRAAEDLGRTLEVGRTIRAHVAATLIESHPELCVFVNLHPSDLGDDELFSPTAPLSDFATRVVLEVSERASLERIPDIRGRVEALRRLGYRIALDDFGAGYAGLSTLRALQPEIVKLDMSLVRDIHLDGVKQTLVSSMVGLCRQLGMGVVAEGVENAAERDGLVEQGADIFQGYHFGRPGPAFPVASFTDRQRPQSQELRAVLAQSAAQLAVPPPPPLPAVAAPPPAPAVAAPSPKNGGPPAPALRLAPALAAALPRNERGVLMRNLSHELRTPLNAIMGFAQLLHDGKCGALTEEQRQHVADIIAGGEQLAQVADDIIVLGSQPEPAVAAGELRELGLRAES